MDNPLNLSSVPFNPGLFIGSSRLVIPGELQCDLLVLRRDLSVEDRAGVTEIGDVANVLL